MFLNKYQSPSGGLNAAGRAFYLKAPVMKVAGPKTSARRARFCARLEGMPGPMKKPNGDPTRKVLALKKWHCG